MIRPRETSGALLAPLILLVVACLLAACSRQAATPGADTSEVLPTSSSTSEGVGKADTSAKGATRVPATVTVTKSITPAPAIRERLAEICGTAQSSSAPAHDKALYFRTFEGDWYRTDDGFASTEWVAPAGALSPDLRSLVIFDCDEPGSICVASPLESEPLILPFRYEPPESADGHSVHWLPGNRRLLFKAEYSLPGQDEMDFRLYLLDLDPPVLYQPTNQLAPDSEWSVSPLGTCAAYSAYDEQSEPARFRLVDVRTDGFDSWFPQADSAYAWPGGGGPLEWSPDGSSLAFSGMYPIIVWNLMADEQVAYNIENGQAFPSILKWNPDGDSIYFVASGRQGGASHWLLDLATGDYKELAETSAVASPNAYQWFRGGDEIIVPSIHGSLLLNVSDGSTRQLVYPGSEDGQNIADMFFSSLLP